MRVGVFDSGIGGLTVLKELIKYHPEQEYIYFGDTKNLPYGTKKREELIDIASKIIEFLIKQDVRIIVIACGTISSTIYNELSQKYKIPIVNVIDTTIAEIKRRNIKNLAVLATPATIESHIFKNKLPDVDVMEISCSQFVPIIEGQIEEKFKKIYIEQYLKEVKKNHIRDIVLGCTHYPLLESDIKDYLGEVNCYNMGSILAQSTYLKPENFKLTIYFSDIYDGLNSKVNNILNTEIDIIEERTIS